MFDGDRWHEILCALGRNRLRTVLTGFSVAWGIFILIILLGSGTGLENGLRENFKGEALNSIRVYGGTTMQDYGGVQAGREIALTNEDIATVQDQLKGVGSLAPVIELEMDGPVRHGSEYGTFAVEGIYPENRQIVQVDMVSGRFLNHADLEGNRKTAVIDEKIKSALFGGAEAVGNTISINELPFTVVGTFQSLLSYEDQKIYIPFTTGQLLFRRDNGLDGMAFLVDGAVSLSKSREIEARTRLLMARVHDFAPEDAGALMTLNSLEESILIQKMFTGIRLFLWVTGIGTIIAGIVGISNIMLITVKERTREIGIRKAVGATPLSVISMVVSEAVLITMVAGYLGLVAGVGVLELVDFCLERAASGAPGITDAMGSFTVFKHPAVDLGIAIKATLLLVTAGGVAGFFPARKAALVKPIEAMKE